MSDPLKRLLLSVMFLDPWQAVNSNLLLAPLLPWLHWMPHIDFFRVGVMAKVARVDMIYFNDPGKRKLSSIH